MSSIYNVANYYLCFQNEPAADMSSKLVYDRNDPNRPRFTLNELKDILYQRNELKARLSDLEDELSVYRPPKQQQTQQQQYVILAPDSRASSMITTPPYAATSCSSSNETGAVNHSYCCSHITSNTTATTTSSSAATVMVNVASDSITDCCFDCPTDGRASDNICICARHCDSSSHHIGEGRNGCEYSGVDDAHDSDTLRQPPPTCIRNVMLLQDGTVAGVNDGEGIDDYSVNNIHGAGFGWSETSSSFKHLCSRIVHPVVNSNNHDTDALGRCISANVDRSNIDFLGRCNNQGINANVDSSFARCSIGGLTECSSSPSLESQQYQSGDMWEDYCCSTLSSGMCGACGAVGTQDLEGATSANNRTTSLLARIEYCLNSIGNSALLTAALNLEGTNRASHNRLYYDASEPIFRRSNSEGRGGSGAGCLNDSVVEGVGSVCCKKCGLKGGVVPIERVNWTNVRRNKDVPHAVMVKNLKQFRELNSVSTLVKEEHQQMSGAVLDCLEGEGKCRRDETVPNSMCDNDINSSTKQRNCSRDVNVHGKSVSCFSTFYSRDNVKKIEARDSDACNGMYESYEYIEGDGSDDTGYKKVNANERGQNIESDDCCKKISAAKASQCQSKYHNTSSYNSSAASCHYSSTHVNPDLSGPCTSSSTFTFQPLTSSSTKCFGKNATEFLCVNCIDIKFVTSYLHDLNSICNIHGRKVTHATAASSACSSLTSVDSAIGMTDSTTTISSSVVNSNNTIGAHRVSPASAAVGLELFGNSDRVSSAVEEQDALSSILAIAGVTDPASQLNVAIRRVFGALFGFFSVHDNDRTPSLLEVAGDIAVLMVLLQFVYFLLSLLTHFLLLTVHE